LITLSSLLSRWVVLATGVVLVLWIAATRQEPEYPELRRLVSSLQLRTTPSGGHNHGTSAPRFEQATLETHWTMTPGMTWDAYRAWLTTSLDADDWTTAQGPGLPLRFVKRLSWPDETRVLTAQPATEAPLSIHLSLEVTPE
jgi:hypothetical protein